MSAPCIGLPGMHAGPEVDDIVLVDDDPLVAEFVRRVLRRGTRRLRAFTDPLEARAWLASHRARVLVVDTRMPRMSGVELIGALARDGGLVGTRVILCSATRTRDPSDDPGTLPAHEWMSKDVLLDRHTLLERLGGEMPPPLEPGAVQPSSAADSSGSASNRSATSP